jgi:hypothetical protein
MRTRLLILSVTSLVFFSCKKADSELPEIKDVKVNNSIETLDFSPGESVVVTGLITDNEELSQFKIDVHHDFDGHSHKELTVRYSKIVIKDISGTTHQLNETFALPADASSGVYHGTITAVDKEGNQSMSKLFYFNIIRPEQPEITVTVPQSVSAGSTWNPEGTVSTSVAISMIKVLVKSEATGNTLYNQTFTLADQELTAWNFQTDGAIAVAIPAGLTGKIDFRVRVEDVNGNNTIFEEEIVVN